MFNTLSDVFEDNTSKERIKAKLPLLFYVAEEESKRAGKTGMEVGNLRERVIVSMLIYFLGEKRVNAEVPATEAEKDVLVDNESISIKTISSSGMFRFSGVKSSWTVDRIKARAFVSEYSPSCSMLLTHICWEKTGALYYIPLSVQKQVFEHLGRSQYFLLPKEGTNPRGVEYSSKAMEAMCMHQNTITIEIIWHKPDTAINVYERWIELWEQG